MKLCPFQTIVQTENGYPKTSNECGFPSASVVTTHFDECLGVNCMAYSGGKCTLCEKVIINR